MFGRQFTPSYAVTGFSSKTVKSLSEETADLVLVCSGYAGGKAASPSRRTKGKLKEKNNLNHLKLKVFELIAWLNSSSCMLLV